MRRGAAAQTQFGHFLGPKQLGLPGCPEAEAEVRAVTEMLGQTEHLESEAAAQRPEQRWLEADGDRGHLGTDSESGTTTGSLSEPLCFWL